MNTAHSPAHRRPVRQILELLRFGLTSWLRVRTSGSAALVPGIGSAPATDPIRYAERSC